MTTLKYPLVVFYVQGNSNIIFAEFPNNLKIDLAIAREIVANRLDFAKNRKHYIIIDVSNVKEITPEAKEYMQRPETGQKNILGAAFIATNPVSALFANIFIKTQKDFQAKFFANKEDAFDWIIACREKVWSKLITRQS
jgi:hypothetical protein